MSRGGHLTVDVARCWFPGFEGRAGEHRVCGGLGDARVLQVAGGDGDGERGMEVMLRRRRLVDVGLLLMLPRHWLEGWRGHGLILGEVHEGEALVVALRCTVSCNKPTVRGEERRRYRWMDRPLLRWNVMMELKVHV